MNRKYMLVLIGVDGAGKTTQAIILRKILSSQYDIITELIHFELPVPLMKLIKLRDILLGRIRHNELDTKSKDLGKTYNKNYRLLLYTLLYSLAGIIFYFKVLYILTIKTKAGKKLLIICDRYPLVDGLAHIAYRVRDLKFVDIARRLWFPFELILNRLSRQMFIQLWVDPRIAHIRRPEHPIRRLELHQRLILLFCRKYRKHYCYILNANRPLMSVQRELLLKVSRWLII